MPTRLEIAIGLINEASDELKKVQNDVEGVDQATKDLNSSNQGTSFSFTELNSTIGVVRQGLQMAEQVYDGVITKTVEMAKAQRDLARDGQITVEEAGTLIQMGDDLQISVGTLETAFREMAKDGIQPTLENLKELAVKYQAADSPTERLKIAQQGLGKSYQDMLPFLEKTPEELDAMAKSANSTGLVMSGPAVEAAHDYEMELDDLGDNAKGVVVVLANELVPAITAVMHAENEGLDTINLANQAVQQGVITQEQFYEVTDRVKQATGNVSITVADLKTKMADHAAATQESTTSMGGWADIMDRAADRGNTLITTEDHIEAATIRDKKALDDAKTAAGNFQQAMNDLNTLMAGPVGDENKQFSDSQDTLLEKQKKLQDQIDTYTAANGQAIPPAANLADIQHQQALASDEYNTALQQLSDAQGAAVTNTQFHYAAESVFTQKVDEAQVAIDQKKAALDKANAALVTASGGTANYSGTIDKLKTDLATTTASIEANAQEHELATKRIVFGMLEQQAQSAITSGQLSGPDAQRVQDALTQTALKMGLIDPATAAAQEATHRAFADLMTGDIAGYNSELDKATTPLTDTIPTAAHDMETTMGQTFGGITTTAQTLTTTGIKPLADKVKDDLSIAFKDTATKAIGTFGATLDTQSKPGGQLYVYDVGIQGLTGDVNKLSEAIKKVPPLPGGIGAGGGGGAVEPGLPYLGPHADGGSFITPGTGSGDRMFSIGLTPGEPVTVGRAGSGGNVLQIAIDARNSDPHGIFDAILEAAAQRGIEIVNPNG